MEAKSILTTSLLLSERQANAVLDMPLKKLTNLERNQIDHDIDLLKEKRLPNKSFKDRELLLELLIEEVQY